MAHPSPRTRLALGWSLPLAALLGLSACAGWPPATGGGCAEFAPPPLPQTQRQDATAQHLSRSLAALRTLQAEASARGRDNGRLALLDATAARATREFAARLEGDSERSLTELDLAIASFTPAPSCQRAPGAASSALTAQTAAAADRSPPQTERCPT